ncbi:protein Z-dependent protease inhibitor [Genypterus blacodes]|uniref:protein Z-dependent protease inhibitor n=1 Tax=Genypterus blacodes TaxID=154954 RepID=UPI003F774F67
MTALKKMKMGFIFIFSSLCFLAPVTQTHPHHASVVDLAFKNMDFAMNLYRKISSDHDNNIFFSPLSISTSFAALLLASDGDTHEEMLKGFNLEQLEREDQPEFIPKLFQLLHENITQNGSLNLDQAVTLFVHREFEVKKTFEDQINRFFDANIKIVDFADTKPSVSLINDYIKQKTGNRVTNVIDNLDPMTQLMLINTIFFQGEWQLPFNPNLTKSSPFYIDSYNIVLVPTMSKEDKFYTMEDVLLGAKLLKLPYNAGVSMLILLPNQDMDYTHIDDEISAAKFKYWISKLRKIKLEIHLPKFKMEQSYPLHNLLPGLGVSSIFTFSANLTRLSKDLKVSEVLHKAVIEVDEIGTTAAAATTTGIIAYSLPRTFIINRPFFFFIYHEDTNGLLFMGRVIDPTKM